MKLLFVALLFSTACHASVTYIGDSIAHGYKIANNGQGITKIGANPRSVLNMLEISDPADTLVLSTGASNDCGDIDQINQNIDFAISKFKMVYVMDAPHCPTKVRTDIFQKCTGGRCTVLYFVPGKDGTHPRSYNKLELMP